MYSVTQSLPGGGDTLLVALWSYVIFKTRLNYFGVAVHAALYSLIGDGVSQVTRS